MSATTPPPPESLLTSTEQIARDRLERLKRLELYKRSRPHLFRTGEEIEASQLLGVKVGSGIMMGWTVWQIGLWVRC